MGLTNETTMPKILLYLSLSSTINILVFQHVECSQENKFFQHLQSTGRYHCSSYEISQKQTGEIFLKVVFL